MSKSAWSEKTVEKLANLYTGDNDKLPEIASDLGKSVSMVRSKLVSMKLYVKPETPKKVGGASSVRKAHIVRDIAKALDMNKDDLESLEKATKPTLEALASAIIKE